MPYKISLNIDGKKKDFKKEAMTLKDNIIAVKHTIRQTKYFSSDEQTPEAFEELQMDYLQTMVDIFNGEFSIGDLEGMSLEKKDVLEKIFRAALGGEVSEEEKK